MDLWFMTEAKKVQNWKNGNAYNTETMLPISQIQWDTMILKDWWLRAIIRVYWLNLDLKNYDEQEITIEYYKRFLNWLDFPIQIQARSTYLDLTDYIDYMKSNLGKIENEVLQQQWNMYVSFLDEINSRQWLIYTKEFYIVVPYYNLEWDITKIRKPWWKKFLDSLDYKDSPERIVQRYRDFIKNRKHLDTRCNIVMEWLRNMWVVTQRLEAADIVALLFAVHNPNSHRWLGN